jgi:hypothetical protein
MSVNFFVNDQETLDAKECKKRAGHLARDGMGAKYPWKGYIGNYFGKTRYNGGCVRDGEWYSGEVFLLPIVADGFEVIHVPHWGYRIVESRAMAMPLSRNTSIQRILNTPGNGYDSFAVVSDKLAGPAISHFEGKDYHLAATFITTAQTAHALKCAVGLRVAGIISVS